jgi:hypothetical protein
LFSLVVRISRASLRKTGEVLRFFDQIRAADFYKRGNCRGFCVKIVLDFLAGRVGFLIKKAQRAGLAWIHRGD